MKPDSYVTVKAIYTLDGISYYDVWWNKNWETWSRVKIDKNLKVEHVSGIKMPFYIRNSLIKYLRLE